MATATELDDRVSAMLEFAIAANPDLQPFIAAEIARQKIERVLDGYDELVVQLTTPIQLLENTQNPEITVTTGTAEHVSEPIVIAAPAPGSPTTPDTLDKLLDAVRANGWIQRDWKTPYLCYRCDKGGTIGEMCTTDVHDFILFKELNGRIVCQDCAYVLTKRPRIPICTPGSDIYPLVNTLRNRINRLSAYRTQL